VAADGGGEFERWHVKSSYQDFVRQEGVPLYEGSGLPDLGSLELGEWQRRGGRAAYTRLGDQENYNLQIVEIPPGGQLVPEHHVYEAIMFVLSGHGATSVWQAGEPKHTVEWREGSLLAIPLNAWHQEFNGSGSEPCRMLFGTNMAQVLNLYHNPGFVFDNAYAFSDRFSAGARDYYASSGRKRNLKLYETNFIPDIRAFDLDSAEDRGRRAGLMRLAMGDSSIGVHLMSVSEGTYVTAHRHFAGPHVIVVEGSGYEIFFMPDEEQARRRVEANPYTVIAPRLNEFHQHFNTGRGTYRMLAFTPFPAKYGMGRSYDPELTSHSDNRHSWTYMIPFQDEDAAIRQEYYAELKRNGIELQLEPLKQGA
jgi:mannose-6-phosphate isomerase-like protein (cupin superfamily)